MNEKINKGIKKMENEEKNIIKIISYVSKINKNKKNINKILVELMRNIKFKYEEDKNNIKYEEYYFNGIPIPKNIIFKDIYSSSINISWNIDNIPNIDNNKIKYRIEIRKENEKFAKVYEGNNNSFTINNLTKNTNYEIRICSLYNNLIGQWSQTHKIKTLELDSTILIESKRENEFLKKLYEWTRCKNMELIFRGTRDGMTNTSFFNKCANQGQTIILIKNDKDYIFGGYASEPWKNNTNGSLESAPESFLFTLINMYNTQPTKFQSKNDNNEIQQYSSSYGPIFGGGIDLGVYKDILKDGGWSNFPFTFQDSLKKGKSIFTGDNNNNFFKIKEIEVFKVFK